MASQPLVQLLTAPWAIQPEKLAEIQAIYAAHVRGEQIDIAAVEARLGRPLASEMQQYTVNTDGVATLEVNGVMAPKANLFMQVSGGVSTQMLTQQLASLEADARVRAVAVVWDSPGGQVAGVPAAAAALASLSAAKPTASLVRGVMASAAYWVGSAANSVMLEGPTDVAGSLGVYQKLTWDVATPNTMELVRGKYKRLNVNGSAPDPEVLAAAEAQLDYLYSVLVDAVAQHRRVSADDVLRHMADGRVFTGQLGIDAGLADGFSSLPELVARLASEPGRFAKRRTARIAAGAALAPITSEGDLPMPDASSSPAALTRDTLEREHPALFAELRTEFSAAGATAERERIQAVRAQLITGHEALIETLAFDGKTTGPEAAVQIVNAERAMATQRAADIRADRPQPLPADNTVDGGASADTKTTDDKSPQAARQRAAALAQAIAAKQAEAAASGRTLSAPQALALIQKES